MDKKKAKEILIVHSDFISGNQNGYLNVLKQKNIVNDAMFTDIMDAIQTLSDECYYKMVDGEIVKSIYAIIFWCRSWLSDGAMLDKKMTLEDKVKLLKYTQIIEEAFYYLLNGEKEEAFWIYNEYLDGRY